MVVSAKEAMIISLRTLLSEWKKVRDNWDDMAMTKTNGSYAHLCRNITKLEDLIIDIEKDDLNEKT